jgi:hypothetical protein
MRRKRAFRRSLWRLIFGLSAWPFLKYDQQPLLLPWQPCSFSVSDSDALWALAILLPQAWPCRYSLCHERWSA